MSRLIEIENEIEKKLQYFIEVGNLFGEVLRDELYLEAGYDTFESYCLGRWDYSLSHGYYLIQSADLTKGLEDPPTRADHAQPLKILEPEERKKVWNKVVNNTPRVTKAKVEKATKEFWLEKHCPEIYSYVEEGVLTPNDAYGIVTQLNNLPEYYNIIFQWGFSNLSCIEPEAIREIRQLELSYSDEGKDILRSGYVQGIPLSEVKKRDVTRYFDKITWEKREEKKIFAGERINERLTVAKKIVADGTKIEEALRSEGGDILSFLFPDGYYTPKQLGKDLGKQGYEILFVVAYKGQPDINFNGKRAKPSSVNGVKPLFITDMIERSTI